jgi:hypothetical protein
VAAAVSGVREDWNGTDVDIGVVVDRLAAQRRQPDGGVPLTLAGVLNLVAYACDPADLDEMHAVIEGLADRQPSRAVLLTVAGGGDGIDATVSTGCRPGAGQSGVALEVVVLTLHGDTAGGAASATTPLLRPDLPTVLWWPGPPDATADGPLDRLCAIADRVVTEVGRGPVAGGLGALAAWVPGTRAAVTDLAWAEITPWRQLTAQMLDAPALSRLRAGRSSVALIHGGSDADPGTLLMAGWMRDLVGDGLAVELRARRDAPEGLLALELEAEGDSRRLTIERVTGRAAAAVCVTAADGARRRRILPLPDTDRARLLAGELEVQRHDRAFERALAGAATVASR